METPDQSAAAPSPADSGDETGLADGSQPIHQIIDELNAFEPSEDTSDNEDRLQMLVDAWQEIPEHNGALPAMLAIFERYPECTALGDPGPLVHAIEEVPGYEPELFASLERQASYYGLWMLQRMLESDLPAEQRSALLARLHEVASADATPPEVRAIAEQFIGFQEG